MLSWASLGDPPHEQIQSCRGRAPCVVGLGHRHPQRWKRLLGRQRRKLGRGCRIRGFGRFRGRSQSLGCPSSLPRWCGFCRGIFAGGAGGARGGLLGPTSSPAGGLCSRSGRLLPGSRGHLFSRPVGGLCPGPGDRFDPGRGGARAGALRPEVRVPRPLVSGGGDDRRVRRSQISAIGIPAIGFLRPAPAQPSLGHRQ